MWGVGGGGRMRHWEGERKGRGGDRERLRDRGSETKKDRKTDKIERWRKYWSYEYKYHVNHRVLEMRERDMIVIRQTHD